ncbi:alpha-L-rhamnosidase C-terminal domain-containing protein [Actinoplanes sp. NPDC051470]|uniref:alpha-L-rhamnosidase-related protein n=1 Tax=Actinoplanes sp. NPDC051470 TaxID=3157224 RepID=UPI003418341B
MRIRSATAIGAIVATLLAATATPAVAGSGPSWARYVVAPSSRAVKPVRIVATTGAVTNPHGLLGQGVTTLSRPQPAPRPAWAAGATATASSFHAPNNGNDGQPRTYEPGNAIDGVTDTFWNDDTIAAFPDVLTITTPAAVALPGITLLSNPDGVIKDFTVETWSGSAWQPAATVAGNTAIQVRVPFTAPVPTTQVRITVTGVQSSGRGDFTRVNEVYPGLVADEPVPSVTVDFGQVVAGYPVLRLAGASAGNPGLRLAFSETKQYLTDVSDFTRSYNGDRITPGTDQVAVKTEPYTWTDTHGCAEGTKVCADGLHGFRYLKISLDALAADAPLTQPYGKVKIDGVSLDFTPFLGTPSSYTGWFESSDKQLNKYWYDASYTNELNTDTFRSDDVDPRGADSPTLRGKLVLHDGPKRDRDPYVGDVAVSGRTAYLTHHQVAEAAKNVLADLADHQRPDGWIPPASINNYTLPLFDYPLYWVTSSWDYVLYTGDTGYATTYYPHLLKVLDTWYPTLTNSRGLLEKGLNGTGGYGDYAFLGRTGEVTYYNALYVMALRNAADLAEALGHADDAARWQARAGTVAAAVNTHLWDATAGAYLDSKVGPVRHGQDGNGYAVLTGIADPARATSALGYLATSTATPYGNSFMDNNTLVPDGRDRVYAFTSYPEIQARFRAGQAESAIDEIKRLYGWMAAHDPGITGWEGIGAGGSHYQGPYTSAAHGWSTGVLPALTNELLGATPTGVGFSTWSVTPHPGTVKWANGQLPTPHGPLRVSWATGKGRVAFTLTVSAPRGTSGDVTVPTGGQAVKVFLDGRPVPGATLRGLTGRHTITVTKIGS